jgi:hypothetical protein
MPPPQRLVTSPDDLAALARAMRPRTERWGRRLGGYHLQQALDAAAVPAAPERRGRPWPQPLTNDGQVQGLRRTAQGRAVPVWGTADRRTGQRRVEKRSAGVSAGRVL